MAWRRLYIGWLRAGVLRLRISATLGR